MSSASIALKYALFAGIATLANLGAQMLSLAIYDAAYSLYVAMFFGTLCGLGIKYILDKRLIFHFATRSRSEDLGRFVLYSLMGVLTTLVFWGTEILFDSLFAFEKAKFLGAALGLAAGYTVKYHLDKRFVFHRRPGGPSRLC